MKHIGEVKSDMLIERDGVEICVDIRGTFTPGFPGCWHQPNGDPGWPPEPVDVEDISASTDGVEVELSDDELENAREKLLEVAGDSEPEFERD